MTISTQLEAQPGTEMSDLARSIIQLADAVTSLRSEVGSQYGVSDNELRAAVRIATEDGVTPRVLSERLRLSTAAVTVIVEHLVQQGFAVRQPNPADKRSTLLELTALGGELVEAELAVLDASVAALDTDERGDIQATSDLLSRIALTVDPAALRRPRGIRAV